MIETGACGKKVWFRGGCGPKDRSWGSDEAYMVDKDEVSGWGHVWRQYMARLGPFAGVLSVWVLKACS